MKYWYMFIYALTNDLYYYFKWKGLCKTSSEVGAGYLLTILALLILIPTLTLVCIRDLYNLK